MHTRAPQQFRAVRAVRQRTNRCPPPAISHGSAGLSVQQAGGQRLWFSTEEIRCTLAPAVPRARTNEQSAQPARLTEVSSGSDQQTGRTPHCGKAERSRGQMHMSRSFEASSANRSALQHSATGHVRSRPYGGRRSSMQGLKRRPNPSIEGTSNSKLRLLSAAPHVKR
jgi:hypothetical protein